MGRRGPVPKRSEDRRGHRAKDEQDAVTKVQVQGTVEQPEGSSEWHTVAQRLWQSLGQSGQAMFYEPSDWAIAFSLMDDLSYYKTGAKRSGQMLQTIMTALSSLLLTEGDRRRVAMELDRKTGDDADHEKIAVMAKWRHRFDQQ